MENITFPSTNQSIFGPQDLAFFHPFLEEMLQSDSSLREMSGALAQIPDLPAALRPLLTFLQNTALVEYEQTRLEYLRRVLSDARIDMEQEGKALAFLDWECAYLLPDALPAQAQVYCAELEAIGWKIGNFEVLA